MAFSNVRNVPVGGGLALIVGDFTQTLGDGSQTFAVGAGRVLLCVVNPQRTADPVDGQNLYSLSTSGAISTLTIYGDATIAGGTFVILIDNGG